MIRQIFQEPHHHSIPQLCIPLSLIHHSGPASKNQNIAGGSWTEFADTLVHQRRFIGVRFVGIKKIVKLGVAAGVNTHALSFASSWMRTIVPAIRSIVASLKPELDGK